jgi:hypothetical protein
MLIDRSNVREGMTVYSSDGAKLGKVLTCDVSTFIIEKGFFFPKDYIARYSEVAELTDDGIRLTATKDSFQQRELGEAGTWGPEEAAARATAATSTGTTTTTPSLGEDVRMPLPEEHVRSVLPEEHALSVRREEHPRDRATERRAAEADVLRERIQIEEDVRTARRDLGDQDPYLPRGAPRDDSDVP